MVGLAPYGDRAALIAPLDALNGADAAMDEREREGRGEGGRREGGKEGGREKAEEIEKRSTNRIKRDTQVGVKGYPGKVLERDGGQASGGEPLLVDGSFI